MPLSKIDLKNEWKGDLNQSYAKRYGYRFPGEIEAKGLPPEKKSSGGWGGRKSPEKSSKDICN